MDLFVRKAQEKFVEVRIVSMVFVETVCLAQIATGARDVPTQLSNASLIAHVFQAKTAGFEKWHFSRKKSLVIFHK